MQRVALLHAQLSADNSAFSLCSRGHCNFCALLRGFPRMKPRRRSRGRDFGYASFMLVLCLFLCLSEVDHAVAHLHLVARLRERRGASQRLPIAHAKARAMPGALHHIAL